MVNGLVTIGEGRASPGWPHRLRGHCASDMPRFPPRGGRLRGPPGVERDALANDLRSVRTLRPTLQAARRTSTLPHKKRAARKTPRAALSPLSRRQPRRWRRQPGKRQTQIAADACADSVPLRRAFRISTPATSPQHSLRKPRFRRPYREQGNTRGNRPTEAAVRIHDAVGTHGACRDPSHHRRRVGHSRCDVARFAERDPHRSSRDGLRRRANSSAPRVTVRRPGSTATSPSSRPV